MPSAKPYRIVIEWDGSENFRFSCAYAPTAPEPPGRAELPGRSFPTMVRAMGNVLRKLRCEHISFPIFLVKLAFDHARLLREIDELLGLLHAHLEGEEKEGCFSCYCSSTTIEPSSSSSG